MIERGNWKAINQYLQYRLEVDQISRDSQRLEESRLRHLLEWANDRQFSHAPDIRPTFPTYILTARIGRASETLSPVYISHVIGTARSFFEWIRKHKRGYGSITESWLDTLKRPRMTIEHKEHEAVTYTEILAIAKAPVNTMPEMRIRAAACFWFLSGIRIKAFITLPLSAIDLHTLTIKQWPKLGVKTKFNKHETTYLLPIPELLKVVTDWDKKVRSVSGNTGLWFAQLSPETGKIIPGATKAGDHRGSIATRSLRNWLKKVGLTYHSPHKFRHGHAVYAIKNAKDIPALKAVSQNLMHSNLSITDGVYGVLTSLDVRKQIMKLGRENIESQDHDELFDRLEILIKERKKKRSNQPE